MKFLLAFFLCLPAFAAIDPLLDAEDRKLVDASALKSAAASTDSQMRIRAAWAYGHMLDLRGIETLVKLARDTDPYVREAAAFNLGQFGWRGGRDAELVVALIPLTHDKFDFVRIRAIEALGKTAVAQTPTQVLKFFTDRSAFVRAAAVTAITRSRLVMKLRQPEVTLPDLADPTFAEILKLANDRAPAVRSAVAYYFVRNADIRGEAALAKLTRDLDTWVKFNALTGLAKMKAKTSIKEFARSTRDPRSYIRVAALNALIASEQGLLPYYALAEDKSFHVRAAFARGSTDEAILAKLLVDKSPTVKTEALKSLLKANPQVFLPKLVENAKDTNWQMRETAAQAASALPENEREKVLLPLATDENKLVKMAALEGLASVPTVAAFNAIKVALESDALAIRGTAAAALNERNEDVLELAWKTYNSSLDHKWVEIRQELVAVIAKSKAPDALKYLKQVVKDEDPSVRVKALQALIARGERELPSPSLKSEFTFTPYRELTFAKNPVAAIETTRGTFTIELFPKLAPIHVANFVGHAKKGFFDGLTWHRVVSNFVIQGADPDGSGFGDAGFSLRAEINSQPFNRGTLGMPRSTGFDTGGIQLFFNLVPTPHLDGQYTVFGQVTKGLETLDQIERGDKILKIRVVE